MAILEMDVRVECDECGDEVVIELTSLTDMAFRKALESEGWQKATSWRGQRDLCQDCIAKEEAELVRENAVDANDSSVHPGA